MAEISIMYSPLDTPIKLIGPNSTSFLIQQLWETPMGWKWPTEYSAKLGRNVHENRIKNYNKAEV